MMEDGGVTRYPQDGDGGVIAPDSMPDYEDPEHDGKPDDDHQFDGNGEEGEEDE